MRTRHLGATDTGLRRSHNEDAFLADEELGLFVVCDGVGGRAFGEVAAQETVEITAAASTGRCIMSGSAARSRDRRR